MITAVVSSSDYRFLAVASRCEICLVDAQAQKILETRKIEPATPKLAPVGHLALSLTHMAAVGDDKVLRVWAIPSFSLVTEQPIPKRANALKFAPDGNQIVVADKFGDLFAFTISNLSTATITPLKDLQPALGHVSMLTDFIFLDNTTKHIATSDRDEHVRISRWPEAYDIHGFCFGHTKFVSSLCTVNSRIISAGADPNLFVWDADSCRCMRKIDISQIRNFAKIDTPSLTDYRNTGKRKRFASGLSKGEMSKKEQGKARSKKAKLAAPLGEDAASPDSEATETKQVEATGEAIMPEEADFQLSSEKPIAVHQMLSAGEHTVIFASAGASCLGVVDVVNDGDPEYLDVGLPVLRMSLLAPSKLLVVLVDTDNIACFRIFHLNGNKLSESSDDSLRDLVASISFEDDGPAPTTEDLYPALFLGRKDYSEDESAAAQSTAGEKSPPSKKAKSVFP